MDHRHPRHLQDVCEEASARLDACCALMGILAVAPMPMPGWELPPVPHTPGDGWWGWRVGRGEGSVSGPGNEGPQMAVCCGGGEGTHLAATVCRSQAVNHAAAVSWLITSLLLP